MSHLGDRSISDIDDAFDVDALELKGKYFHARDSVYEMHDWRWAKKSVQLQLSATPPTVRYPYAYALPTDYSRLANVADNVDMDPQLDDFDIVDRRLTSSSQTVFLEYVANSWSEAIWPAYFADCVAMKLAILVVARLTHDLGNRQLLEKSFSQQILPYARSIDSQSQPARKPFIRSEWQKARWGSRAFSTNLRKS